MTKKPFSKKKFTFLVEVTARTREDAMEYMRHIDYLDDSLVSGSKNAAIVEIIILDGVNQVPVRN